MFDADGLIADLKEVFAAAAAPAYAVLAAPGFPAAAVALVVFLPVVSAPRRAFASTAEFATDAVAQSAVVAPWRPRPWWLAHARPPVAAVIARDRRFAWPATAVAPAGVDAREQNWLSREG